MLRMAIPRPRTTYTPTTTTTTPPRTTRLRTTCHGYPQRYGSRYTDADNGATVDGRVLTCSACISRWMITTHTRLPRPPAHHCTTTCPAYTTSHHFPPAHLPTALPVPVCLSVGGSLDGYTYGAYLLPTHFTARFLRTLVCCVARCGFSWMIHAHHWLPDG